MSIDTVFPHLLVIDQVSLFLLDPIRCQNRTFSANQKPRNGHNVSPVAWQREQMHKCNQCDVTGRELSPGAWRSRKHHSQIFILWWVLKRIFLFVSSRHISECRRLIVQWTLDTRVERERECCGNGEWGNEGICWEWLMNPIVLS